MEAGSSEVCCNVRVQVFRDVELFTTLDDFKSNVTRSALKWFEHIEIAVGDRDPRITVSFVKRSPYGWPGSPACDWLKRGVLIRVETGLDDEKQIAATLARDKVRTAAKRGALGESTENELTGESWTGSESLEQTISRAAGLRLHASRLRRIVAALLTPCLLLALLLLLANYGHEFLVHKATSDRYIVGPWSFAFLLVAGIAGGWLIVAPVSKWSSIWPPVAVRERGLLARVLVTFWAAGVALVVPAVVILVWGLVRHLY
jgi:hypothetical protein